MFDKYILFNRFSCLQIKFFAQFFFIDVFIIFAVKLRTVLLIENNSLFVKQFICAINSFFSTADRRCLWVENTFSRKIDWFFHRLRRVLSITSNFLTVASTLSRFCNFKSVNASSIEAIIEELSMVELNEWKGEIR